MNSSPHCRIFSRRVPPGLLVQTTARRGVSADTGSSVLDAAPRRSRAATSDHLSCHPQTPSPKANARTAVPLPSAARTDDAVVLSSVRCWSLKSPLRRRAALRSLEPPRMKGSWTCENFSPVLFRGGPVISPQVISPSAAILSPKVKVCITR